MKRILLLSTVILVFAIGHAGAEIVQGININFVTIGNPGNLSDTRPQANPTDSGTVDYEYRIGKYEITNFQWNTFVAAAGTPTGNLTAAYNSDAYFTSNQQPTNNISWYEAAQFCNYLTTGDKSKGVYRFSGEFDGNGNTNPGNFLGIDREGAETLYGTIYSLPTEDEWYKAAYYKPDGSGYSTYANGTNTAPLGFQSNYGNLIGTPWDVGSGLIEQNGTFDMMGNVGEWYEKQSGKDFRVTRGGSYKLSSP